MGDREQEPAQLRRGLSRGLSQGLLCAWGEVVSCGHMTSACGASVSAWVRPARDSAFLGPTAMEVGVPGGAWGGRTALVVWPGGARGSSGPVRLSTCSFLKGK